MKTLLRVLAVAIFTALSACGPKQVTPVTFNPTVVVDEICQGLLNNTFQTRTAVQSFEYNGQNTILPLTVSFLVDGRLVWNYENNQSYIGTFDCSGGHFSASFTEGSLQKMEGDYSPEEGTITIDGDVYYLVTEI